MSKSYNFHNRDIWVKGPIVKPMFHSFVKFWSHEITQRFVSPIVKKCSIDFLTFIQSCEKESDIAKRDKVL